MAILCCGPSLNPDELHGIGCRTIGVNMSYVAHQSTYHVFTAGPLIYGPHRNRLHELTPNAKRRFSAATSTHCETPPQIAHWSYKSLENGQRFPEMPVPYCLERDGWVFCGGAPVALQVAVGLNFSEVVFVGLDLKIDGRIHFYQEEVSDGLPGLTTLDNRVRDFGVQRDCLERFKPWLKELGVRVLNAGESDAFERVSFAEVFSIQ